MLRIGNVSIGDSLPFVLIAGPCQIESRALALETASSIRDICGTLGIGFIYKSSFDKANRTSLEGKRGIGIKAGLEILSEIRQTLDVPVLTDVHLPEQCDAVAEVADVLQIPAFLCRQTDLLLAAGQTGKAVNIKKGQFLAPGEMRYAAEKIRSTGNEKIMLCERGTFFGYNNLVNDFRALPLMRRLGYPVVFDATHSVQTPGSADGGTGGTREFILPLSQAAAAAGIDGLFLETHPNPGSAPSDGQSMLPLAELPSLLARIQQIDRLVKSFP